MFAIQFLTGSIGIDVKETRLENDFFDFVETYLIFVIIHYSLN